MSARLLFSFPLLLAVSAGCSTSESEQMRNNFIGGCARTSGNKSLCQCIYSEFEKQYTGLQLKEMNTLQKIPDNLSEKTVEATLKCQR